MRAIRSGLDAKDRVVVNGLQRIHQAGEVVDPKEERPPKEDVRRRKWQHALAESMQRRKLRERRWRRGSGA